MFIIQVYLITAKRGKNLLLVLILLSFSFFCKGMPVRWTGAGADGLWANPVNWDSFLVPGVNDEVILDNLFLPSDYAVQIPDQAVLLLRISVIPAEGKQIRLTLPVTNLQSPALTVSGGGYGIFLTRGAVFVNASGLANGESIQIADSFYIGNGAQYIHRTKAQHANGIVRLLSTAPGTEKGIFEFDVPRASYTVSASNRKYGSLLFNSQAAGGIAGYACSGNGTLTVRGDLSILPGVTLNIDLSGANGNIDVQADFIQQGGTLNLASGAGNTSILKIAGNMIQLPGSAITETNTGKPVLAFTGNGLQTISIRGVLTNDVSVLVNNASGIYLENDLVVPYRLVLQKGRVAAAPEAKIIVRPAASLEVDSTKVHESFVACAIRKEGLLNETGFLFPVGKTSMRWLELKNATGDFTVEYTREDAADLGGIYGPGIDHVSAVEYWKLMPSENASAEIELSFLDPESGKIDHLESLTIAGWQNGIWLDAGKQRIAGDPVSGGSVLSDPQDGWDQPVYFCLAGTHALENPLPILLSYFRAESVNLRTNLKWRIDYPDELDHFELERSEDAVRFDHFASIQPIGSEQDFEYGFKQELNCRRYYRLLLVEKNASIKTSGIVVVDSRSDSAFSLVPRYDVSGRLNSVVVSSGEAGNLDLIMYGMDGKKLDQKKCSLRQGTQSVDLTLANLPAGVYLLVGINSKGYTKTLRLVKWF